MSSIELVFACGGATVSDADRFEAAHDGSAVWMCLRWLFDSGRTRFVARSNAQRNLSSLSRKAICDTSISPNEADRSNQPQSEYPQLGEIMGETDRSSK
eukprot:719514-Prymnesium_polylepis.1